MCTKAQGRIQCNFKEHYGAMHFFCKWSSVSKWCCRARPDLQVPHPRTQRCKHSALQGWIPTALQLCSGCCKDLPSGAVFSAHCLPLLQNLSMKKATTFLHWALLLKMSLQSLPRAARLTKEASTADKCTLETHLGNHLECRIQCRVLLYGMCRLLI